MPDVTAIQSEMEKSARPGFDDKDIQNLRILVRVTFEFHEFLSSCGTRSSDDVFEDMLYTIDKILIHVDSFRSVLRSYGILQGATRSRIDWSAVRVESAKDVFSSLFPELLVEASFEKKCRVLLDLFKLQIVFAGANYDCAA